MNLLIILISFLNWFLSLLSSSIIVLIVEIKYANTPTVIRRIKVTIIVSKTVSPFVPNINFLFKFKNRA